MTWRRRSQTAEKENSDNGSNFEFNMLLLITLFSHLLKILYPISTRYFRNQYLSFKSSTYFEIFMRFDIQTNLITTKTLNCESSTYFKIFTRFHIRIRINLMTKALICHTFNKWFLTVAEFHSRTLFFWIFFYFV